MTNKRGWIVSFLVVFIAFIYFLSPILSPFLLAALIAYLLDPLVNRLSAWGLPRTLAVTLVFMIFSLIFFCALLILIPLLSRQVVILLQQLPNITSWLQTNVIPWLNTHLNVNISQHVTQIRENLSAHLSQASDIFLWAWRTVNRSGMALLVFVTNALIVPVVSFYLLRDWHKVLASARSLLPRKSEQTVIRLLGESDSVISAFFRGQLIVMLALAIVYSVGLWFVGLNLSLLIGLLAGLVSIVPYLGFIVGILVASLAAFFQFHAFWPVVYVWLVFGVGQVLETAFLTPVLVGDKIGLHPVAVIFAILAGGQLFGFVGVLLALPLAAVLVVILREIRKHYKQSALYQE